MGGQLHRDKECPFSGVTSSGPVWRKVLNSKDCSVPAVVTGTKVSDGNHQSNIYITCVDNFTGSISSALSPWYKPNGWLGVKHQVTYLLQSSVDVKQSTSLSFDLHHVLLWIYIYSTYSFYFSVRLSGYMTVQDLPNILLFLVILGLCSEMGQDVLFCLFAQLMRYCLHYLCIIPSQWSGKLSKSSGW